MPRINPTVSNESKEIYDSKHNFERGPFVDRAIQTQELIETGKAELIEKHNKESNPFTEEQQKVIDILIEEIRDIRDEIERLRR